MYRHLKKSVKFFKIKSISKYLEFLEQFVREVEAAKGNLLENREQCGCFC